MKSLLLLPAVAALLSVHSYAGSVNEVPSCYAANKIEVKAAPPAREIFVLVDQTTISGALELRQKRSMTQAARGALWRSLDCPCLGRLA